MIHWSTFGFRLVFAGDSTARICGQRITCSSGHMCGLEIIEGGESPWRTLHFKVQRQRCDVAIDMTFLTFFGIPMISDVLAVISGPLFLDPDSWCQETLGAIVGQTRNILTIFMPRSWCFDASPGVSNRHRIRSDTLTLQYLRPLGWHMRALMLAVLDSIPWVSLSCLFAEHFSISKKIKNWCVKVAVSSL